MVAHSWHLNQLFFHQAGPWCFSSGLADTCFWVLWQILHCGCWIFKCILHHMRSRIWLSPFLLWSFAEYMMNGKWDQNFLFPGGSGTRNLSTSSSPMSTLSSNYRGAGGSFVTDTTTTTTYMSGAGTASIKICMYNMPNIVFKGV